MEGLENAIKLAIDRILNETENIKQEKFDDYGSGKRIAYVETLTMLKNSMIEFDIDVNQFGLNVDIDNIF